MKVEGGGGGLSENPDETLEIYNGNAFQFLDGLGILNLYFNGVPFSRWLIQLQKQYVDNVSYLLW